MQIKTTMDYTTHLLEGLYSNQQNGIPSIDKDVGKQEPSYCWLKYKLHKLEKIAW